MNCLQGMAGLVGLTMKQDIKSPNELSQKGIAEQKCQRRRSDSRLRMTRTRKPSKFLIDKKWWDLMAQSNNCCSQKISKDTFYNAGE